MLKKILVSITFLFMIFLFSACDQQTPDFENLSNRELKSIYESYDKYPINIGHINGKNYGIIVSSSSSAEEALEVATNHFTNDSNTVVGFKIDIETQFFYGVYIKLENNSSAQLLYYDEYVISYKKDIFDCLVKSKATDIEHSYFNTKDQLLIKQIMDYKYYSETYQTSGSKLFYSEVVQTDDSFFYKTYGSELIGGDTGMQDKISLVRIIWEIDKSNGELSLSSKDTIKTIYVD